MKRSEWFCLWMNVSICIFWLGWFIFSLLSSNESLNWHKACTISSFWAAYASIGWFNLKADRKGEEKKDTFTREIKQ